jgi:hypothetical protein
MSWKQAWNRYDTIVMKTVKHHIAVPLPKDVIDLKVYERTYRQTQN